MKTKRLSVPSPNLYAIVKQNARLGLIFPIFFLIIQNLIIFNRHYFQDYGFPWDFLMGYYPITAYWTSLVSQGYIPTWIPFQQMGFPMSLLLQSGFNYPVFWIFPIFQIQYTLHAAVVFQCLHILFGSIGMFLFLRLLLKSNNYALLGAFAFQFFGGFYSNAQHADIVRSFAFAPWLFYCFHIFQTQPKISWRNFLIPIMILFLATGGYPGNFISSIFIMGVFVFFQIAQLLFINADRRRVFSLSIFILSMTILGVGLSFYHLGPGWLFRSYMVRSDANISHFSLGIEYLSGLFLNNDIFSTEISMTSSFITMPMLFLIVYLPGKAIKQWWPMMALCFLSMLMIAGPDSVVWFLITKLIPLIKLSRFPSSDYRIFIIIPIIFFATIGAKALIEHEISRKNFLIRTLIIVLLIAQGIYYGYLSTHEKLGWLKTLPFIYAMAMLAFTSFTLIIFFFIPHRKKSFTFVGSIILISLMAIDAIRVLPNMITWQTPNISSVYQENNWPLEEHKKIITYQLLENLPRQRPARIEKANINDYSWQGYITGQYLLNDLVPYVLKSPYLVDANRVYREYMEKAWTPLLFDVNSSISNKISISDAEFSAKLNETTSDYNDSSVKQTRYGINEITYEVSLDEPQILVENEIYFPGWKAQLDYGDVITEIKAFSTNDIFRTWVLPPGHYHMVATFEFPNMSIYFTISLLAFFLWFFLLFLIWAGVFWRSITHISKYNWRTY